MNIPWREPGPDFTKARRGREIVYLRRDLVHLAPALLSAIDQTLRADRIGAGNKRNGFRVTVEGLPELFVRRSTRGGLAHFLGDIFFGFIPRMVHELAIICEARKRGVEVPEPLGAMVESLAPAVYRGALITRAIAGMTLWEFVEHDDDARVRTHVFQLARQAIDTMHESGVFHNDLNLHNLFVSTAGDRLSIVIMDFDKSRLYSRPLRAALRRRNLRRLARSIRKLDPKKNRIDDAGLALLTSGQFATS